MNSQDRAPATVEVGPAAGFSGPKLAGTQPAPEPARVRFRWRAVLLRPELGLPLITLVLAAYLSLRSPYFLQWKNIVNIMLAQAVVGTAAAFATLVVISGGIDLTPVTIMTVTGIVSLKMMTAGASVGTAIVVGLTAAVAIGLLNGALIALLDLNPFIVTLGTNFLFTGAAFLATTGNSQLITNQSFLNLGQSNLAFGIPIPIFVMIAAFGVAFAILRFTRLGVHLSAVGGGEGAARLNGVRVSRVKIIVYVMSGLSAGVAGVLLAAYSGSIAPSAASNSNDLLAILAAVIIGGTALTGGRGSVVGTFVGVVLLGLIGNGLVLLNVSEFWQPVVTGVILLLAIVLDRARLRSAAST